MRIIKATESISVEHPIFVLNGQPGICKSSLGFSCQDSITANFDGQNGLARAVNRGDAVDIATIDEFREFRQDRELLKAYKTVVIDTGGRAVDLLSLEVIDDTPKYGRNGSLTLQGFGDLKTRFRLWMADLRTQGKDILIITHNKEDKDGDTVFNRPDIQGASLAEVLKIADFVGFVYMNGKNRVLDFNPTEKWFGKNPANWKPFNVPTPDKAKDFFAKLFDEGRKALGKISEESSKVTNQVDDWRAAIETFTTTDELNKAIPEASKLSAIVAPQVKKLIMDRAKALKFEWSVDKKGFVDKAEKVLA